MGYLPQRLYNEFNRPLSLDRDYRKSGVLGWLVLATGIVAYDIYAIKSNKIETLTRSFWRLTEKSKTKIIPIGVWLGLTFHLLIEKPLRKNMTRSLYE